MPGNHPLQQNQYIGCFDRAVSMKNVALPRIVIDDAQNTQFAATLSPKRNPTPTRGSCVWLEANPWTGRGGAFEVWAAVLAVPLRGVCAAPVSCLPGSPFHPAFD